MSEPNADEVCGSSPLLSGTLFDDIDPMRHLETVVRIVERLNEIGEEQLGEGRAHFEGTRHYLCIMWGEHLLWDSEYQHREDRDFGDEEGYEPTLELCCKILSEDADKTHAAFAR